MRHTDTRVGGRGGRLRRREVSVVLSITATGWHCQLPPTKPKPFAQSSHKMQYVHKTTCERHAVQYMAIGRGSRCSKPRRDLRVAGPGRRVSSSRRPPWHGCCMAGGAPVRSARRTPAPPPEPGASRLALPAAPPRPRHGLLCARRCLQVGLLVLAALHKLVDVYGHDAHGDCTGLASRGAVRARASTYRQRRCRRRP